MKKKYKFLLIILTIFFTSELLTAQFLLYEDDFESYTTGGYIAVQNPEWWTTWSGSVGGGEDAIITEDIALSGSKSVLIDETGGATDLLWLLGDIVSGVYYVNFYMYVPVGYCAYYNFQHMESPGVEWAFEMYFHTDGSCKFLIAGETLEDYTYTHDTWIYFQHIIYLDGDHAELYIDGVFYKDWQWSLQAQGAPGANQLGAVDFYAGGEGTDASKYYLDDVKYFREACIHEPIIIVDPNQFDVSLNIGQSQTNELIIGNIGEDHLIYTISIEYTDDDWLSVNPTSGTVLPYQADFIDVNFDATGLDTGIYLATIVIESNDVLNPTVEIPVSLTITVPHFNFEGGDPSSPLWTIYISGATSEDDDLVAGDQIAIFDGDLMVGLFTLDQICTPENQFENDLIAFSVLVSGPGYQGGNPYLFKCWDASEELEVDNFDIELFDPYGDAYTGDVFPYDDGEYSIVALDFLSSAFQTFNLSYGFQFISSAINPENPDMLVVMADVLNDNLDFARNSLGQTLRKIGPNWVNGIGDWIIDEGYLVKMFADDSFSINGYLVNHTTPIPVESGFQFVSYFPRVPIDALDAYATIIGDDLDFVRNSNGQTLRKIGPNWINGIGHCQPGEGYLVKMFTNGILIYPGSSPFTCGDPFTDPRNEQTYNTVQIGDQCWMVENLNIGERINGFHEMTNNGVIEKYCYDNDPANCDEYGGLYQWNEIMQYVTDTATQGICPEAWYIPTDCDFTIITDFLGGESVAGGKMKETGTAHWWPPNAGATNESGFTALPGSYRSTSGLFYYLGYNGYWWSSTAYSSPSAWIRGMCSGFVNVSRLSSDKADGFSVRCLRDNGRGPFDNLSILDKKRSYELSDLKRKNNEAVHFVFEGGNPAEAVYTIYIEGLEVGDEVAAYDGDILVGATIINSQNTFENELPVFSTLINGQGYKKGNPIILKVWSENNIVSVDFTMESIYDSYVSDVFPVGDGKYSIVNITKGKIENTEETISIYPNPSKGIFSISLEGVKGDIQIKVFDSRGKEYSNFELSESTSTQLDLTDLAAGVYFLSFSGKGFSQVKKIVIR
jgi:uncharacterized protein (TIGR02145 family)